MASGKLARGRQSVGPERAAAARSRSSKAAKPGRWLAPPLVGEVLRTPGRELEPGVHAELERDFGHAFGRVRVHTDARAARSADDIGALAYSFGSHMVFASGRYAPRTPEGRKLLTHELAHVVQQPAATVPARLEVGGVHEPREAEADRAAAQPLDRSSTWCPAASPSMPAVVRRRTRGERRLELLAAQVYDAIDGLGTDEQAVYQALQELGRNDAIIKEFMEVYRRYYAVQEDEPLESVAAEQLVVDIEDDFSGGELDFALALINRRPADAELQIAAEAPSSASDVEAAARRIWEAVNIFWGTDEEAIYAVLIPFGRDQQKLAPLRAAYERVALEEGEPETLEDRILDEMSGWELDYAIYLLFDPQRAYAYYLKEAPDVLSSTVTGGQRTMGSECFSTDDDAFDSDYWKAEIPGENEMCALMARTADRPSQAIVKLFDQLAWGFGGPWKVDCAEWVQIHHLYAMLKLLGPYRFDLQFGGQGGFWLEEHRSTGLSARALYVRTAETHERQSSELMLPVLLDEGEPVHEPQRIRDYEVDESAAPQETEELLRDAPVGSRIMWSNGYFRGGGGTPILGSGSTFTFENSIKLGDDAYGAHGFTFRKVFTRAELEEALADQGKPDGMSMEEAVRKFIFIEQIEIYSTVADQPWESVAR